MQLQCMRHVCCCDVWCTQAVLSKPVFTIRPHCQSLCFLLLAQVYVDKARLEANQPGGFASLKNLFDIGDIIGARGSVKRTEKGELSVVASELQVLTKSLLPLPDKWHGLADVEKRYR